MKTCIYAQLSALGLTSVIIGFGIYKYNWNEPIILLCGINIGAIAMYGIGEKSKN